MIHTPFEIIPKVITYANLITITIGKITVVCLVKLEDGDVIS